jgi:hypothetical protein
MTVFDQKNVTGSDVHYLQKGTSKATVQMAGSPFFCDTDMVNTI